MPERISASECARVAKLAHLSPTDEELDRLSHQLGDILDHANDMASLDLDGVEPTAHPYPLSNVLRDDEPTASIDRDEVLSCAPDAEQNMFRVPPVMGEAP